MTRKPNGRVKLVLTACLAVAGVTVGLLTLPRNPSPVRADEKPKAPADKEAAGGWGTLTGRFVYGGPAPEPAQIPVPNKPEFAVCKKHPIYDEGLVVNGENRGIANVFVYLRSASGVHPDLAAAGGKPVVLDQENCRFVPHAQLAYKDQGLLIKSGDPIKHNTRMSPLRNPAFNQIIDGNNRKGLRVDFVTGERFPFEVRCDLHPWMNAWILVLDHPYGAVSCENGEFKIEKLPAGEHSFIVWQEKTGYLLRMVDVDLENADVDPRRGQVTVVIRDGETTDLGDVVIPPEKFTDP